MLGLMDKNIITVTITIFHLFKVRDMKIFFKRTQIKLPWMCTTMSEVKNALGGLMADSTLQKKRLVNLKTALICWSQNYQHKGKEERQPFCVF